MPDDHVRLVNLPTNYPRLFASSPLPYGLEVGEGWVDLLEILCSRINTVLAEAPEVSFQVLQVKEKFGTLRFYYRLEHAPDAVTSAVRQAVDATAAASASCCEQCGERGLLASPGGWLRVRCPACADK